MTHLPLSWWPKPTSATATTMSNSSRTSESSASTNCCGLSSLIMRRLKKRSKRLHPSASRQTSFQCRYDPLSYSLNFDTSGPGDYLDEDYYKFYAFSSRFVAAPTTHCQPRLVPA
ncbi:hypothetical protein PHJA_002231100 [Phtheirospermum japonicum]|uniref:Uncharacterized protein n=1 Tax=Phtheirospermum japonicum TaxID=374723 RepID=A0A830D398_9LAMI|nr:hypothetical protein PHJA_002231100 [Phtheirospermum japonicum]